MNWRAQLKDNRQRAVETLADRQLVQSMLESNPDALRVCEDTGGNGLAEYWSNLLKGLTVVSEDFEDEDEEDDGDAIAKPSKAAAAAATQRARKKPSIVRYEMSHRNLTAPSSTMSSAAAAQLSGHQTITSYLHPHQHHHQHHHRPGLHILPGFAEGSTVAAAASHDDLMSLGLTSPEGRKRTVAELFLKHTTRGDLTSHGSGHGANFFAQSIDDAARKPSIAMTAQQQQLLGSQQSAGAGVSAMQPRGLLSKFFASDRDADDSSDRLVSSVFLVGPSAEDVNAAFALVGADINNNNSSLRTPTTTMSSAGSSGSTTVTTMVTPRMLYKTEIEKDVEVEVLPSFCFPSNVELVSAVCSSSSGGYGTSAAMNANANASGGGGGSMAGATASASASGAAPKRPSVGRTPMRR